MMGLKLNIGDPKSKKTFQLELSEEASRALRGKRISETFKGELIDKPGYEFLITGGSDNAGFPLRRDVEGEHRKRILITRGVGNRRTRKGIRLRRTVAGNTICESTVQVNVKVTKHGKKPLVEGGEGEAPSGAAGEEGAAPAAKEGAGEKAGEKKEG